MATPSVWLVLGDKLGDNAQVERVVAALDWPVERRRLVFLPEWQQGKPRFEAALWHVDAGASDPLAPPWPDIVITVGRRPAMAAQWIREQSGGHTQVVLFGRPKKWIDRFALIVATGQYVMPERHNVMNVDLPLMDVAREKVAAAAGEFRERLAGEGLLTAVMVGGQTKPYRFDAAAASDLAAKLNPIEGRLFVTTSRRTPVAAVAALREALREDAGFYEWKPDAPDNPYFGLLALADRFVVTGDSMSMLVEVARLGRPLAIAPLPVRNPLWQGVVDAARRGAWGLPGLAAVTAALAASGVIGYPRNLERLHDRLVADGHAVRLGEAWPSPQPVSPDADAARIAARIRGLAEIR